MTNSQFPIPNQCPMRNVRGCWVGFDLRGWAVGFGH